MDELIPIKMPTISSLYKAAESFASHLDAKTISLLAGMGCITTILCVAFVSFSGCEMSISKNGFSISRPK